MTPVSRVCEWGQPLFVAIERRRCGRCQPSVRIRKYVSAFSLNVCDVADTKFFDSRIQFHSSDLRLATTRRARATSSFRMDGQNSEAVMHQVQSELANAYAQEFFTVRSRKARDRLPRNANPAVRCFDVLRRSRGILTDRLPFLPDRRRPCARSASRNASRSPARALAAASKRASRGAPTATSTPHEPSATWCCRRTRRAAPAACSERNGRTCEREKRT